MGYKTEEQAPLTPQYAIQEQGVPLYPGQYPYQQLPQGYVPYAAYPYGAGYSPQFTLRHPIVQNHKDRVGSQCSFTLGTLLGFFAPIISLITLCCSKKLKFKHGLSLGHAIYYTFATLGCLIMAIVVGYIVLPSMCSNMDSCMVNALNGSDSASWGAYVIDCNVTHKHSQFKPGNNYTCELPRYGDVDNLGPQTYECAKCACDYQKNYCAYAHSYISYTWFCVFFSAVLLFLAVKATKYYKRRIADETASVYQL